MCAAYGGIRPEKQANARFASLRTASKTYKCPFIPPLTLLWNVGGSSPLGVFWAGRRLDLSAAVSFRSANQDGIGKRCTLPTAKHHEAPKLRTFELFTLTALIAAALLIGAGVWTGTTQQFDQAFLLALRVPGDPTTPIGPKSLSEMARDVTALGGVAVLTILTLLMTVQFLLRREWTAAILVAVSAISGTMLSNVLKVIFDRPRPDLTAIANYGVGSFPSGHSTASAVVYLTLGMLLAKAEGQWQMKIFYVAAAIFLTGLVGVSRLYLGVHYPTDVAAGWSIGAAWAIVCRWVAARFDRRLGSP